MKPGWSITAGGILGVAALVAIPAITLAQRPSQLQVYDRVALARVLPATIPLFGRFNALPLDSRKPNELVTAKLMDSIGHAHDYRWEGAAAGAIGLGLVAGLLAAGFCNYDGRAQGNCPVRIVGGVVFGAAIGAGVGAMIGSTIPKEGS